MKQLSLIMLCSLLLAFAAAAADIQVLAPAAGASWKIGTTQTVQWTFSGLPASTKVHILLWHDGTNLGKIAKQYPIGTNGQGSFAWSVGAIEDAPAAAAGTEYTIKIRTVDDSTADVSGAFSLVSGSSGPAWQAPQASQLLVNQDIIKQAKPAMPGLSAANPTMIRVSKPKSGDEVAPYGGCAINWETIGITDALVSISLMRNGQPVSVLAASVPNPGDFLWNVETQPPDPGSYKIAVETLDKKHRGLSGEFTVAENGTVTLVSPNTGETIFNGSSHEVRWNMTGNLQKLNIILIKVSDGSISQTLGSEVDAELGALTAVFSPGETGQYRVHIRDARNSNGLAVSGIITIINE